MTAPTARGALARAFWRANPLTRLALIAVAASMLPLWPPEVLLAATALALGFGSLLGFGPKLALRLVALLAPVGLVLFVVQGLLIPRGTPAELGPLVYYPQGLAFGLKIWSRLALLLSACLIFLMTTRPADFARALDGAGLPPAVSYLLTAPLALIEGITEEAKLVRDSLHMRGYSARGSLRERLRMLAAVVTPLIRGLITEAPSRAEFLDLRGFRARPRRSLLLPYHDSRGEIALRRGLVALALLQLGMLAL